MRNTLRRKQNPYLFLKIGEDRERFRRVCVWTLCLLRRFRQRIQWIVTKDWGKTENGLKNCLWNAKHAFFATGVSRQQVAKASRQNTHRQNYEKIFQLFFATGRSTRKGVASWATKISMYPSRLDLSLAIKLPKSIRELKSVACDLDDPWLSHQNRATLFLKIFSFCKNKVLSKNT